jgi:hypothetical protein
MQMILLAYILAIAGCTNTPGQEPGKDSSVLYAGTTPCNNIIRSLHKITPEADCQAVECKCALVEWKLTIYHNPTTLKPMRYKLSSINRFVVKETNMYSQPGTKAESEGSCTIVRGTKANPNAIVYRLNPDKPEISLDLLKLSDNLFHIVDHEGRLMIGNEFFSYTLSRVAN